MALQPRKRQLEVVSPSLLKNIKIHPVPRRFSFGMDEFVGPEYFTEDTDCESLPGPSAKKRKSLSLKKPGKENNNPLMTLSPLPLMNSTINMLKDLFRKTPENAPTGR